jgi:glycosyltransferase involved in cell wall biosynthesis
VLDHGRAGLLVDTGRPEAIADAVCTLFDDGSLRAKLGAAALERTRATFSPAVVSATWMQLFEDMARTRR